jgi:hypothetical protein
VRDEAEIADLDDDDNNMNGNSTIVGWTQDF